MGEGAAAVGENSVVAQECGLRRGRNSPRPCSAWPAGTTKIPIHENFSNQSCAADRLVQTAEGCFADRGRRGGVEVASYGHRQRGGKMGRGPWARSEQSICGTRSFDRGGAHAEQGPRSLCGQLSLRRAVSDGGN